MESNLILRRSIKTTKSTMGQLYRVSGDSEIYMCDILEDVVRNPMKTLINKFIKVFGKTAIPYGRYEIIRTPSNRFKDKNGKPRILPELLNVPLYSGVRIHSGNKAEDTEGCLLPGMRYGSDYVVNSRDKFKIVDAWIENALNKGKVFITITD